VQEEVKILCTLFTHTHTHTKARNGEPPVAKSLVKYCTCLVWLMGLPSIRTLKKSTSQEEQPIHTSNVIMIYRLANQWEGIVYHRGHVGGILVRVGQDIVRAKRPA
jgi:hypothetical protein